MTQGPRERSAPLGGVQAGLFGVQPGTATGQPAIGIGDDGLGSVDLGHDHSYQDGPVALLSATHAGSNRLLSEPGVVSGSGEHVTGLGQSSAPTAVAIPWASRGPSHRLVGDGAEGSTSGRMSIRHPVSLAARRAFCPSLPMARDSW